MPLWRPQKCVLPVLWFATGADRFSQIPHGADVERYKLSSDLHNCASDWGNSDDKIDWDAFTNGDID